MKLIPLFYLWLFSLFSIFTEKSNVLDVEKGMHVSLIGGNLCSRMMNYGYFETEIHARHPEKEIYIRNFCDGGDTPAFRAHSGRNTPWAFDGAENFQDRLQKNSHSQGHFDYPDAWLEKHKTDVLLAFFGSAESFDGVDALPMYKEELRAFIHHTNAQKYNGKSAPKLILISPTAFEDLSYKYDLPTGQNQNLELYVNAMEEVAQEMGIPFINSFEVSQSWFNPGYQFSIDGLQLNDLGYKTFSSWLVDKLFGGINSLNDEDYSKLKEMVLEKNWYWHNDYKIPNGVHVFGRRHEPFGPDNYPDELIKVRQLTSIRDTLVWRTAQKQFYDVKKADSQTHPLSAVTTNFPAGESIPYLYGDDALKTFTMAPGFKIELFASEKEFPDLANPSQIAFDNKGRLWVACMPSYPHYKAGDGKPNDKLIILEDTDGDQKADKQTIFVDGLHVPAGFEFAPEGVYVSQGTNLKLYSDTDGDDKADKVEIIYSGFDDHDTHHVISAFCADPSGAIYMGEGVFLHTNVETPYGTVRATNGGFMRFAPQRRHLERVAQLPIPNPWGIAFDQWGENFFASTSSPDVFWMAPGTIKSIYGLSTPINNSIIEENHRVRPTSGLEFIHSRHFPDNVQGNLMINNTIGFLGTKVHKMIDDESGYVSKWNLDLVKSSDPNFRPVDMEFAPDGSLYLADWHNILIGHMQHNARDPLRDHVHGRIYRITYPSKPLVPIIKIDGASISSLLNALKEPEYRTRYRARRELREHNPKEVLEALDYWLQKLNPLEEDYERFKLEALWVSWGLNSIHVPLLKDLLKAKDFKVRAAAVKVLRYTGHQVKDQVELLQIAAKDPSPRVRVEAFTSATWLPETEQKSIVSKFEEMPLDKYIQAQYTFYKYPNGKEINNNLSRETQAKVDDMGKGREIYSRDGSCATCHGENGKGIESAGFPPLIASKWVMGSPERLVKLILHGLYGPIEVNGKTYPGNVPMTPWKGILKDEEIALVANYIRNSWGNVSSTKITPELVGRVAKETAKRKTFYSPNELLKEHPHE